MANAHVDPHVGLAMELVRPAAEHLDSYRDTLRRGWFTERAREDAEKAAELLAKIDADPQAFLEGHDDPVGGGEPITLDDGTQVPRLPSVRRWMWDGAYCGGIGVRYQPGTAELPSYVLGHIGYAVVPWKRGLGYATAALGQMLPVAATTGLPYVDIVIDVKNLPSQAVTRANGGVLVREFVAPESSGSFDAMLFRIDLG